MPYRILTATFFAGALLLTSPAQAEDLRDTLISVYNKNPRLLAERARLREIDETYVQARAQGRPSLAGSGSISKSWVNLPVNFNPVGPPAPGGGGNETFTDTPNEIGVQIVQPLYQGGRVKALKQQAKLGVLAARENLRAQENSLFQAAANAYVDVLRDEEAARIRRNNILVLSRQLEAANARFDVGQGTRTDVAQSDSRVALAEAGLAQAEAQLEISRATYRRLVGRNPDLLVAPPLFQLPPNLPEAIRAARENNPQLIASYYNEAAGRAAIDVAKAAGRPTISLNGGLVRQRDQLSGISELDAAEITAQITVPFYSGGANRSRVRQAEHAKTRLSFETRDVERAIDQNVTQIWAQLTAARASLAAARRQEDAATLAFEGVTLEQSVGTRDQLDVLNAEQEVLNAKLAVVDAQRNVNAATFGLLATIGVFDAEGIQLSVEAYDAKANFDEIENDGLRRAVDNYVPGFAKRAARALPNLTSDEAPVASPVSNEDPGVDVLATRSENRVSPVPYDPLLDGDDDGQIDPDYRPKRSSPDSPVD